MRKRNSPERADRGSYVRAVLRSTGPISAVQLKRHPQHGRVFKNWSAVLSEYNSWGYIDSYNPVGKDTIYFVE